MGQYYAPVVKDNKNNFEHYYSWDYDNGLKLMEHSYIGNNFVESIVKRLLDNPMRIAWVGDYADEKDFKQNQVHNDLQDFIDMYDDDNEIKYKKALKEPINDMENSLNLFMINHTKKLYINMWEYVLNNLVLDKKKYNYGDCVHPLPLLTALGNGKGGGDYRGINKHLVGIWAGDLIEFVNRETWYNKYRKDYIEFEPLFREE